MDHQFAECTQTIAIFMENWLSRSQSAYHAILSHILLKIALWCALLEQIGCHRSTDFRILATVLCWACIYQACIWPKRVCQPSQRILLTMGKKQHLETHEHDNLYRTFFCVYLTMFWCDFEGQTAQYLKRFSQLNVGIFSKRILFSYQLHSNDFVWPF